jgi:GxxExxY protein
MLTDPEGTNTLTRSIIGCGIKVHRALGPGLLESAYTPCLAFELVERGFTVELKKPVPLVYRGKRFDACYWLDMMVNGLVIVELKSVEALAPIHKAQLLTYLRLTDCPVGLLLNFNVEVLKDGIQRVINPEASNLRSSP